MELIGLLSKVVKENITKELKITLLTNQYVTNNQIIKSLPFCFTR